METETRQKPRRRGKRSFKYIIRFFQIIFGLIAVFIISFFVTLAWRTSEDNLPEIQERYSVYPNSNDSPVTKNFSTPTETGIGEKFDRLFNIEDAVAMKRSKIRHYVLFKDIPRALSQAFIAVEDKRFYAHGGFDIESIARATLVNVEEGEIAQGGSTITQQLAKNLFLTQERSFTRKVEELFLAIQLERHYDKNKILEMYLNTIYFGSNFYGIYDAAHGYFDKEPKDLSVAECAMLAGIPNAPSIYSPYVNFMLAKQRQLVVIDAMVKAHFLGNYEAENARVEEIFLRDGAYY